MTVRELRTAATMGLLGGTLFGLREGLATLRANAFVEPDRYFAAYLAVPLLGWLVLGLLATLPALLLRATQLEPRSAAADYAAHVTFWGVFAMLAASALDVGAQLHAVGFASGAAELTAWGVAVILALAVARTVGAVVARLPETAVSRLALVAAGVLAGALGLTAWSARLLVRDWRWQPIAARPSSGNSERPNVLLVSIDTLRADHGAFTPTLDRLAREGVAFARAFTVAPWTLPAMASLLTARAPHHHGAGAITNRRDPLGRAALPPGAATLATTLRANGYRTHAIVTNPYLAPRFGLAAGFAGYEDLTLPSEFFLAGKDTTPLRLLAWAWPGAVVRDTGDTVSTWAERWLDAAPAAQPFFLWLHYIDAHAPYGESDASFRGDSLLGAADDPVGGTSLDVARLRSGEIRLDAAGKARLRDLYRADVAGLDAAIGRVLAALDRAGLARRTLVVVASDHGEEFFEHGGVEHGHTLYDELLHVPLLMRLPGRLPAGRVVTPMVRLLDVAPTVLDLLGLPPLPEPDGASLLPVIRGEDSTDRPLLAENLLFAEERRALRVADRKYVRWDSGKEEVYDLVADPQEQRDLAGRNGELATLRAQYAAVTGGDHATIAAAGVPASAAPPGGRRPDVSLASGLRALGYLR